MAIIKFVIRTALIVCPPFICPLAPRRVNKSREGINSYRDVLIDKIPKIIINSSYLLREKIDATRTRWGTYDQEYCCVIFLRYLTYLDPAVLRRI